MTLFDYDARRRAYEATEDAYAAVSEPGVKVRHDARPTSQAAADKMLARSGTARRRVYDLLVARGEVGATDDEIQDALAMPPNTERPRRVELVDREMVADSGRVRPSRWGNDSVVWVAL